jgi:hypothetical protein
VSSELDFVFNEFEIAVSNDCLDVASDEIAPLSTASVDVCADRVEDRPSTCLILSKSDIF